MLRLKLARLFRPQSIRFSSNHEGATGEGNIGPTGTSGSYTMSDREITNWINSGRKLPRKYITDYAYQIDLFEPEPPKPLTETLKMLEDEAELDFVPKTHVKYSISCHFPDMKQKKGKFTHVHSMLNIPHTFGQKNEIFVFAESSYMVKLLLLHGFKPAGLESQATRVMLNQKPGTKDYCNIFACEDVLVKRMNRDAKFRERMSAAYPAKNKGTTNELSAYSNPNEWVKHLEDLRDNALVIETSSPDLTLQIGDATLKPSQVEEPQRDSYRLAPSLQNLFKSQNIEWSFQNVPQFYLRQTEIPRYVGTRKRRVPQK